MNPTILQYIIAAVITNRIFENEFSVIFENRVRITKRDKQIF